MLARILLGSLYFSYTSDFAKNAERAISAKGALHVFDCLSHRRDMILREFYVEFSYILMTLRKKLNESPSCISLFNITALKANYTWNFRLQLFRQKLSHRSAKAYATRVWLCLIEVQGDSVTRKEKV